MWKSWRIWKNMKKINIATKTGIRWRSAGYKCKKISTKHFVMPQKCEGGHNGQLWYGETATTAWKSKIQWAERNDICAKGKKDTEGGWKCSANTNKHGHLITLSSWAERNTLAAAYEDLEQKF